MTTVDAFRKKRNISEHERIGLVSDAESLAMRRLAVRLRDDVVAWVTAHHPSLLRD